MWNETCFPVLWLCLESSSWEVLHRRCHLQGTDFFGHPGPPLCISECLLLAPPPWRSGAQRSGTDPPLWAPCCPNGHAAAHREPGHSITTTEAVQLEGVISQNLQRFKCDHVQLCPFDHLLESFTLKPTSFLKRMRIYEWWWVMSHRQVPDRTLSSISLQVTYLGILPPFCATLSMSHSHSLFLLILPHPTTFI